MLARNRVGMTDSISSIGGSVTSVPDTPRRDTDQSGMVPHDKQTAGSAAEESPVAFARRRKTKRRVCSSSEEESEDEGQAAGPAVMKRAGAKTALDFSSASVTSAALPKRAKLAASLSDSEPEGEAGNVMGGAAASGGDRGPSSNEEGRPRAGPWTGAGKDAVVELLSESDGAGSDGEESAGAKEARLQEKTVEFLNQCSLSELQALPHCGSVGTAARILNRRPFEDWEQAFAEVTRLANVKAMWTAMDIAEEREVANALLEHCEGISTALLSVLGEDKAAQRRKADGADGECDHEALRDRLTVAQPACMVSQPALKGYQLIGLNWLAVLHKQNVNAVLADEMGLGKTVQSISFLAHLFEQQQGPFVVVVPSSVMDNWKREFGKWCPCLEVLELAGPAAQRRALYSAIRHREVSFDVCLVSYTVAMSTDDKKFLTRQKFACAVFDEGHMLKNMKSKRYQTLMKIRAERRVLLTGTPLQNNLMELISLVSFIMPHIFTGPGTVEVVRRMFNRNHDGEAGSSMIAKVKRIISPFLLRRLKTKVLDIPDKLIKTVPCVMTETQQRLYDSIVTEYKRQAGKAAIADERGGERKRLYNLLMQLRKAANHPLLHRQIYTDDQLRTMSKLVLQDAKYAECNPQLVYEDFGVMTDYELMLFCDGVRALRDYRHEYDVLEDCGKVKTLLRMLHEQGEKGQRVLVFSQFTTVLDLLGAVLKRKGFRFLRLDGSTPVADRQPMLDEFTGDEGIPVFLLSTRAGGLGINLIAANVVIIYDIDFNPWNDKQAEDRCHRVGQTKPVEVYRFVSKGSVEELMDARAKEKLDLEKELGGQSEGDKEDQVDETFLELLSHNIVGKAANQ